MFENKKILVLGMARSGYDAAKYLIKHGNTVILNDGGSEEKHKKEQVKELKELGVTLIFGSHPDDLLDDSFDYLIKNPGIPIDHKYVLKARELNIEVINEAEMAYRLLPDSVTLIGITGTNGKTTTTTLTYEMIKESGKRVHLAGNIGYPLTSFLDKLDSISMNMAKNQGLALNPSKINGACGRLMCCLTYENDNYTECRKQLPEVGKMVETEHGTGKVVSEDVLNLKYTVNINNELKEIKVADNGNRKEWFIWLWYENIPS